MARQNSSPAPAAGSRGRVKQIWQMFRMTRKLDPQVVLWMLLAFFVPVLLGVAAVLLTSLPWWLVIPSTVLTGFMLALIVMARRAEKAVFKQMVGQPGATSLALKNLRGWNVEEQPAAIDPKTQDLLFRAVGRPGVILVTEGPLPRVKRLSDMHARQLHKILGEGVPVTVYHGGDGEGQIPLIKLTRTVTRAKPVLTKQQIAEVSKRLKAMGAARPPLPKGIDPMRARPDRRASRGR